MRKFLPYILIVIILVGFLGAGREAQAQSPSGTCRHKADGAFNKKGDIIAYTPGQENTPQEQCGLNANAEWIPAGATTPSARILGPVEQAAANKAAEAEATSGSPLQQAVEKACGKIISGSVGGCLVLLFYYIFYTLTSFVLVITARFFDIVVALGLSSALLTGEFIGKLWEIVRDLSNLFFILVLLYIAIRLILGLGGETKKMIAHVIIMALLINFSMFFTKVVIDTSNVLALIFYNKIDVTVKKDGKPLDRNHIPVLDLAKTVEDKGLSAALVSGFDPSRLLSEKFFKTIQEKNTEFSGTNLAGYVGTGALIGNFIPIPGVGAGLGALAGLGAYFLSSSDPAVPIPLLLGIIFVTGVIMAFASYAFFIAGLSFVSRLIELWVLIVFSPFAFMSLTIPILEGVKYIGWKEWTHRLLTVSFMAPIFMFFLYFIFLVIKADPLGSLAARDVTQRGWMETILLLVIPAMITLILLIKATSFAKESSGALGEAVMKVGGLAAGLALGVATGGAALAGRTVIGGGLGGLANKVGLKRTGNYLQSKSYDARAIPGAGKLLGAAGLASGAGAIKTQEGGWTKMRKEKVEKRMKRADELKVGEDERLKQALNKTEGDLQALLAENAQKIETLDKTIEKKRQEVNDASSKLNAAKGTPGEGAARATLITANGELDFAKQNKKDFHKGLDYMITDPTTGMTRIETGTGVSIDALEDQKKSQVQAIKTETAQRKQAYANKITRGNRWTKSITSGLTLGIWSGADLGSRADREAAAKIRSETKLDSGTKT